MSSFLKLHLEVVVVVPKLVSCRWSCQVMKLGVGVAVVVVVVIVPKLVVVGDGVGKLYL